MSSSAEAHHTRHLKLKNADFYWLKTLDFGDLSRKKRSEPIWIAETPLLCGVWFVRKKSSFMVGISFPVTTRSLLHVCIILLVWVNNKIECRGQNCRQFWVEFVINHVELCWGSSYGAPETEKRDFYRLKTKDFWWFIKKRALRAHFYLRNVTTDRCMVRKEEIIFSGRYFIFSHPKVSSTRVYNLIGMV